MGRYTKAKCKLCRREGEKLFLKGDKCYTETCTVKKRHYAPGHHGKTRVPKSSDYKVRLREKQKDRRMYGISERQFENYFNNAARSTGVTGEKLLEFLERRLDNVVYRLGLSTSRQEARQFVKHGHFLVNNKKVNIPSYQLQAKDVVNIRESSAERMKKNLEKVKERKAPAWLAFNEKNMQGTVEAIPKREDIDASIDELLIVEYYSR